MTATKHTDPVPDKSHRRTEPFGIAGFVLVPPDLSGIFSSFFSGKEGSAFVIDLISSYKEEIIADFKVKEIRRSDTQIGILRLLFRLSKEKQSEAGTVTV